MHERQLLLTNTLPEGWRVYSLGNVVRDHTVRTRGAISFDHSPPLRVAALDRGCLPVQQAALRDVVPDHNCGSRRGPGAPDLSNAAAEFFGRPRIAGVKRPGHLTECPAPGAWSGTTFPRREPLADGPPPEAPHRPEGGEGQPVPEQGVQLKVWSGTTYSLFKEGDAG